MGYTLDQLNQMGATPVGPQGQTLDQLKAQGATPVQANQISPQNTQAAQSKGFGGFVSQSSFNPNNPKSQFEQPSKGTKMDYSNDPGTNVSGHAFSGTRDALGDMFVKPVQHLVADAGTRIPQAVAQTVNELRNPGYDTAVDTGNPQRQNAGGTATPLPLNTPSPSANTSNLEARINKPQNQLGVTVPPQQTGVKGTHQIAGQALNAVDAIGNVALAGSLVDPTITGLKSAGNAIVNTAQKVDVRMGGAATETALNKLEQSAIKDTWKKVSPELKTPTQVSEAAKSGRLETSPFGAVRQSTPTAGRDLEMTKAAAPYVKDAKTELDMVKNMQKGIEESANTARAGLKNSKAIWNVNELKGKINQIELPISVKSDQTLLNTFENTKKAVLKLAEDANRTPDGLLDMRQHLDRLMEDNFGSRIWNREDGVSQVYKSFRTALNNLADSKVTDGALKAALKKQSLLYDAIDNVAPKIKLGNVFAQFAKNNPKITKAIKYGATAVIGGEAVKHVIP